MALRDLSVTSPGDLLALAPSALEVGGARGGRLLGYVGVTKERGFHGPGGLWQQRGRASSRSALACSAFPALDLSWNVLEASVRGAQGQRRGLHVRRRRLFTSRSLVIVG